MAIHEFYMLCEDVWDEAVPHPQESLRALCIGCIEARLGRQLRASDFTNVGANVRHTYSDRLRARLADGELSPAPTLEQIVRRFLKRFANDA